MNLKLIEELRTKEELIAYFKQNGINVTEEQITKLKQNYENINVNNNNKLTLEQLDNIAGGLKFITCATHESFTRTKNSYQADIDQHRALAIPNGEDGGLIAVFDGSNGGHYTMYCSEGEKTDFQEQFAILNKTLGNLSQSELDEKCNELRQYGVLDWDFHRLNDAYQVAKTMCKSNGNNKEFISINNLSDNCDNIKNIVGFLIGGLAGVCLAVGFSGDNNKNKK